MLKALVLLLPLLPTFSPLQAQTFKDVDYLYRADVNAKPKHVLGRLVFSSIGKNMNFVSDRRVHKEPFLMVAIAGDAITSAVYERTATPRYAAGLFLAWPLIFTKEKKHYLTLQYKTNSGDGKYAIFQLDKGNYREALAALEATLGQKLERSEEH